MLLQQGEGANIEYLQPLCDAGRLLCHVLHKENLSRKELLPYNLEKSIKQTLVWVFGSDLEKRMGAEKQLNLSVLKIRANPAKRTTTPMQ